MLRWGIVPWVELRRRHGSPLAGILGLALVATTWLVVMLASLAEVVDREILGIVAGWSVVVAAAAVYVGLRGPWSTFAAGAVAALTLLAAPVLFFPAFFATGGLFFAAAFQAWGIEDTLWIGLFWFYLFVVKPLATLGWGISAAIVSRPRFMP